MAVFVIDCYIGLFGTGLCRFCFWVELPVQKRLCLILVKNVGLPLHSRVFRRLTGSQRTPGKWGVIVGLGGRLGSEPSMRARPMTTSRSLLRCKPWLGTKPALSDK